LGTGEDSAESLPVGKKKLRNEREQFEARDVITETSEQAGGGDIEPGDVSKTRTQDVREDRGRLGGNWTTRGSVEKTANVNVVDKVASWGQVLQAQSRVCRDRRDTECERGDWLPVV